MLKSNKNGLSYSKRNLYLIAKDRISHKIVIQNPTRERKAIIQTTMGFLTSLLTSPLKIKESREYLQDSKNTPFNNPKDNILK